MKLFVEGWQAKPIATDATGAKPEEIYFSAPDSTFNNYILLILTTLTALEKMVLPPSRL